MHRNHDLGIKTEKSLSVKNAVLQNQELTSCKTVKICSEIIPNGTSECMGQLTNKRKRERHVTKVPCWSTCRVPEQNKPPGNCIFVYMFMFLSTIHLKIKHKGDICHCCKLGLCSFRPPTNLLKSNLPNFLVWQAEIKESASLPSVCSNGRANTD